MRTGGHYESSTKSQLLGYPTIPDISNTPADATAVKAAPAEGQAVHQTSHVSR